MFINCELGRNGNIYWSVRGLNKLFKGHNVTLRMLLLVIKKKKKDVAVGDTLGPDGERQSSPRRSCRCVRQKKRTPELLKKQQQNRKGWRQGVTRQVDHTVGGEWRKPRWQQRGASVVECGRVVGPSSPETLFCVFKCTLTTQKLFVLFLLSTTQKFVFAYRPIAASR